MIWPVWPSQGVVPCEGLVTLVFEGLSGEKGGKRLKHAVLQQRTFVYEHIWRPTDVLVWDNR
jgi:alpha-ketoglutarate-dependent taurine dioxygenase